jgi:hypothetical protein
MDRILVIVDKNIYGQPIGHYRTHNTMIKIHSTEFHGEWCIETWFGRYVLYHKHSQGFWRVRNFGNGPCNHTPPDDVINVYNLINLNLKLKGK